MDDRQLDHMLQQYSASIDTTRLWRVRRSILTSIPPRLPLWRMPFQPRPAMLAATAMLGLMLGAFLPTMLNYDGGTTADIVSPVDPTYGFG